MLGQLLDLRELACLDRPVHGRIDEDIHDDLKLEGERPSGAFRSPLIGHALWTLSLSKRVTVDKLRAHQGVSAISMRRFGRDFVD
jgi:hypothetical protein